MPRGPHTLEPPPANFSTPPPKPADACSTDSLTPDMTTRRKPPHLPDATSTPLQRKLQKGHFNHARQRHHGSQNTTVTLGATRTTGTVIATRVCWTPTTCGSTRSGTIPQSAGTSHRRYCHRSRTHSGSGSLTNSDTSSTLQTPMTGSSRSAPLCPINRISQCGNAR